MARDGRAQQLSLFLLLASVGHVLCQTKYAKTGTNYTFEPSVTAGFESVLWKFKNDKVVEYEDGQVRWFQFKDQGRFDEKTGVLTLEGLSKTQSGLYESEILVKGTLQPKKFEIQVIDAVSEPKVNCTKDNKGTVTSLECFLEPEVNGAEFTWGGPGDKKTTGQTLQIPEEIRKDNNALFFCTAKNPVSEMETEFYLKDCVPGNGNNTGALVGVVIGTLLLLVIVIAIGVAVYFLRQRTGAGHINTTPDEETRTGMSMQENTSNSNNCTKDDGKDLEGSNNNGHGNTEKVNAEQEDLEDSGSEKTDRPNTVNSSDERPEEDQEMPKSAEKGQGDTPTPQEILNEDKNSKDESNGGQIQTEDTPLLSSDADPPHDEEPEPVSGTSNEESAEGQIQTEDTPLIVDSPGNEDTDS